METMALKAIILTLSIVVDYTTISISTVTLSTEILRPYYLHETAGESRCSHCKLPSVCIVFFVDFFFGKVSPLFGGSPRLFGAIIACCLLQPITPNQLDLYQGRWLP
jgi:hypothetical protein